MLEIDQNIRASYPGFKMGILIMQDVSCSISASEMQMEHSLAQLLRKYSRFDRKEIKERFPVKVYVDYYKKFKQSYPLLAQLESVLKGKKALGGESALLLSMFFCELDSMLLTAGHDLAKIQLPLQLKIATGTEFYQSISGKEVIAVKQDLMLSDTNGAISSILRGPNYESRITPSTTAVIFTVYAFSGIDADYIQEHLIKLQKQIQYFAPFSKTECLQVFEAH